MLIRVIYQNDTYDMAKDFHLNELISSGKIIKFFRSGEWVTIGSAPVRGMGGSYNGVERRRIWYIGPGK